ncbi:putative amino acid exporter permease [Sulfurospirillum diekertiae]|uniref:Amino acid exporter permease n=1 Tax=Sulfurospirillum diekertiae TaxID=1854492 RepID=A0A290HEY7_9BACT|nr:EamA family transporter [Sulfurospirillum diekertiae]ATB69975.1 putative amino acid exporter permease [Sulfurospirillum diekertiae]
MPLRHILLALSVVVIWGVNFVVIQVALQELPPLLLTFFRFFFATFPAIFFFKRPQNTSWKMLFFYSLSMFILDFAFLFSGMYAGVSSGIASLALQTQVFFTAILAVIFIKEKMTLAKIIGAIVAFSGIVFVGFHAGGDVNLLGLALVECAALSWAIGNLVSKQIGKVDMLSLVVWGSLISLPFLLALSYIFESHLWSFAMFMHLTFKSIGAIAYLAYPVTFFGFGIWSWLLSRYPATTVAPFTLLVPVVGFTSSAILVGEALPSWKLIAACLIVTGLVINLYGDRLIKRT